MAPGGRTTSRAMSNPLLSSYSSCFVVTKHPVQLKTVTTNIFSKYFLFKKGHLNKRADVWTPLLDPPLFPVICTTRHCESLFVDVRRANPRNTKQTAARRKFCCKDSARFIYLTHSASVTICVLDIIQATTAHHVPQTHTYSRILPS